MTEYMQPTIERVARVEGCTRVGSPFVITGPDIDGNPVRMVLFSSDIVHLCNETKAQTGCLAVKDGQ